MCKAISLVAALAIGGVATLAQANDASVVVHKLTGTILDSGTNSGISLPANTWTTIDATRVNCKSTQGCTYGFETMLELNCVNETTITIGSLVDGTFSPNQPNTLALGSPVVINNRNSLTAPYGKHSLQVQVDIVPLSQDPQCTLADWEIDYREYTP